MEVISRGEVSKKGYCHSRVVGMMSISNCIEHRKQRQEDTQGCSLGRSEGASVLRKKGGKRLVNWSQLKKKKRTANGERSLPCPKPVATGMKCQKIAVVERKTVSRRNPFPPYFVVEGKFASSFFAPLKQQKKRVDERCPSLFNLMPCHFLTPRMVSH
jgi:hypothetical protein